MTCTNLLPEHFSATETDDRYDCYSLSVPVRIFGFLLEEDTMEDCFSIALPAGADLEQMLPVVNEYIRWLGCCEEELTAYFEQQLDEPLPADWYDKIEVMDVSITFDSSEDYGATIAFGESVCADHTIEIDIDGREITDSRLIG